ncbi:hypothetical protein [Agrococcus sp. TF02-05]|uniref:hypothetical protein n=1 Tax=Agrococcus sp. TF02-05 TaxID=2815211 RepID=UPI001AA14783|nr:hypothetical protein [Agrococcus sp. TF02-05]MBO1770984.1 hypothetical protein [Agrococcus sp. TF02-05]
MSVNTRDRSTASDVRRTRLVRTGQGTLIVLCAMCAVIGLSTIFVDDPFAPEATIMTASFACLAAALGVGAVLAAPTSLAARLSLVAMPLFFAWHVAALGTWIPDAVLAAVSVAAVLMVILGARRHRGAEGAALDA